MSNLEAVHSWCPGPLVHISSDCPFFVSYSGKVSSHQKNCMYGNTERFLPQTAKGQGELFTNLQCELEINSGADSVCFFLIT